MVRQNNSLKITVYRELNRIIKLGEEKINEFHKARKDVDSFSRVISSFFNKKVYQECYDELYFVTLEIQRTYKILEEFDRNNRLYFVGAMKRYLNAYKEYLKCAKTVSEKRLEIQRLILRIKTVKNSRTSSLDIMSMMNEVNRLLNDCKNKGIKFNEVARQVKTKGATR